AAREQIRKFLSGFSRFSRRVGLLLLGLGEPLAHELDLLALRVAEVEELEAGAVARARDAGIGAAPADGRQRVERIGERGEVDGELDEGAGLQGLGDLELGAGGADVEDRAAEVALQALRRQAALPVEGD